MLENREEKCAEQERLLAELKQALAALVELQGKQLAAMEAGDQETSRLDEEIHAALSAWQRARFAYIQHVKDHRCRF